MTNKPEGKVIYRAGRWRATVVRGTYVAYSLTCLIIAGFAAFKMGTSFGTQLLSGGEVYPLPLWLRSILAIACVAAGLWGGAKFLGNASSYVLEVRETPDALEFISRSLKTPSIKRIPRQAIMESTYLDGDTGARQTDLRWLQLNIGTSGEKIFLDLSGEFVDESVLSKIAPAGIAQWISDRQSWGL